MGAPLAYEDMPCAGVDGRSSNRLFHIPGPDGTSLALASANLEDPLWQRDAQAEASLITRLTDLNAGFTSAVVVDLPAPPHWGRVRLHIGDFAQDYCGEISAVHSFQRGRVFAIVEANTYELALRESDCPMSWQEHPRQTVDPSEPGEDRFGAFCQARAQCLARYCAELDHQLKLRPAWLSEVEAVETR